MYIDGELTDSREQPGNLSEWGSHPLALANEVSDNTRPLARHLPRSHRVRPSALRRAGFGLASTQGRRNSGFGGAREVNQSAVHNWLAFTFVESVALPSWGSVTRMSTAVRSAMPTCAMGAWPEE